MLECNSFAENTAGQTACISAQIAPNVANLGQYELFNEQFMLIVLDTLARAFPGSWALLQAAPACDLNDALRFASCAMQTIQPQFQVTPAQMQAQILWMLNDTLCGA
jgi:hypothetical protein